MDNIPTYISGSFIVTVVVTVGFIFYAINHATFRTRGFTSLIFLSIICFWILMVSILAIKGFFLNFTMPPKLLFFTLTPLIVIATLFVIRKSRTFIKRLPITSLTYIHIIRIPIEMVLLWLATIGVFPIELTFEGANYNILTGITSPFVGVFLIPKLQSLKHKIILIFWNIASISLLIIQFFRVPKYAPFFGDIPINEMPYLAGFTFPFVLFPTLVVPILFFCHIVSVYQLVANNDDSAIVFHKYH